MDFVLLKNQLRVVAGDIPGGKYSINNNGLLSLNDQIIDLPKSLVSVEEQSSTQAKNWLLGAAALPFILVAPLLAIIAGLLAVHIGTTQNVCALYTLKDGKKFIGISTLETFNTLKAISGLTA